MKRKIDPRENLTSYIALQTTRKLPLFHGDLPITEMHRRVASERSSYIPLLLHSETRSDVLLVRAHFCSTLPKARQPISHGKVYSNGRRVSIAGKKVSHGDLISLSFPPVARSLEDSSHSVFKSKAFSLTLLRRSFYIDISLEKRIGRFLIDISLEKRIGRFLDHPVIMWRRTKAEWFRLLQTQRGCCLLLSSPFLRKLRLRMLGEKALEDNGALWMTFLRNKGGQHRMTFLRNKGGQHRMTFLRNKGGQHRKRRSKRIELPTHYSEVNHRTRKAVVSAGPMVNHVPHDIRLKDSNLPLRSAGGRGQNI